MSRVGLARTPTTARAARRPPEFPWDMPDQFLAAERIADKRGISREDVDWLGLVSQQKAATAVAEGASSARSPHPRTGGGPGGPHGSPRGHRTPREHRPGPTRHHRRGAGQVEARPPDGRHTAGNSSQISDGASAVLWMSEDRARAAGLRPRARIVAQVLVGSDPYFHLDGPAEATTRVLDKAGMTIEDIDLFEVNEAFASVVMSWAQVQQARHGQGQRQRRRHRPRPPGRRDGEPPHHHHPPRARAP